MISDRLLVFELENSMARKPATRARFTLFDVFYEDGSQRSRRRVPSDDVEGQDGEARIRAFIEQQDREIAEKSGIAPPAPNRNRNAVRGRGPTPHRFSIRAVVKGIWISRSPTSLCAGRTDRD